MSLTPPAADLRFAGIIAMLCRMVAARIAGGRLAGPLIILICRRLRRLARRFSALAARHAAGRLPARRHPRGTPRTPRPARPAAPSPLPRDRAWLIRLVPEAAAGTSHLQLLLAEPEMAALIAAAPQTGRILRPLCHMLGVRPPAILALPPRPAPRRARLRKADGARLPSATASPAAAPAHRDAAPPPPCAPRACGPPGRAA